jgi:hypothetical protein
MQIYVHRNNQQLGPFTEAEVRTQLAAGAISPQDHVWWQGQSGWVPLSQTHLAGTGAAIPGAPTTPATPYATAPTSKLAIWALVCGCLSLVCGLFGSIPAIILGHMGLSETKKNPLIQGRGMALAGMILGYVFTTLIVIYLGCVIVLVSMGNNVSSIFKTIDAQMKAAEAATNSADQNPTPTATPDASTNSDQSTNSASASTNSPDSSTNSDSSSTNAPSSNAPSANQ